MDAGPGLPGEPLADIYAPRGEMLPRLASDQDLFERGRAIAESRAPAGAGPIFTVDRCLDCHERRGAEWSVSLVRDALPGGSQLLAGVLGIVPRHQENLGFQEPAASTEVAAIRCSTPLYGAGLLGAVDEQVIFELQDPSDEDGDGISGRANFEGGAFGRFGWKAQTSSLERIIRGQLFVHQGLTSRALTPLEREGVPDPAMGPESGADSDVGRAVEAQFVDPDGQTTDGDTVDDPELDDLAALVSWVVMLAPLSPSPATEQSLRGALVFDRLRCSGCHTPSLATRGGTISPYTDLLVHDMGEERSDGVVDGLAGTSEYRTAPLWHAGLGGPYLHDCSAGTLDEAIRLGHGGEAEAARAGYQGLDEAERADLLAFVRGLGGAEDGATPVPDDGQVGSPPSELSDEGRLAFERGFRFFMEGATYADGLGPRLSGSTCVSCHRWPGVGGAGDRGNVVIRQGRLEGGEVTDVPEGSVIYRFNLVELSPPTSDPLSNFIVDLDVPPLYPVRAIESVSEAARLANEDADDADGDGVSGRSGGEGRFGWSASSETLEGAIASCAQRFMGLTASDATDGDGVSDPELSSDRVADLALFIRTMTAPPSAAGDGLDLFGTVGCDACHTPSLPGGDGEVTLYSDLLLHEARESCTATYPDGNNEACETRTPSLLHLSLTPPYLSDASAPTIEAAIAGHGGEASPSVVAFTALGASDRALLLSFLEGL